MSEDDEWINYCNESFVFPNFESEDKFTERVVAETAETNLYLNKAGMLSDYVKKSPAPLLAVFFLIVFAIFFLLWAWNRFSVKRINYDQFISGGILSVSLFFLYQTFLFQIPESVNITSPALIPRIWIAILVFLSILLVVRSKNKEEETGKTFIGTVLLIIAFLIIYLVAMQWVGYYVTTPLFILSAMYLLNYRKTSIMVINAFGFVLFSYLIFNQLLHIDLPLGRWFI